MSDQYDVRFTDFSNKGSVTVDADEINTETSVSFIGRNKSDYGLSLNENFLHLLENFANNDSPSNPVEGQLWYDTTAGVDQLKIYDGTGWVSAGGIKKASSAPDNSASTVGDLWVDTVNQQLFIYTGSSYVLVGPTYTQGSATGPQFVSVIGTDNIEYPVVINYVNSVPITIYTETEFTPKSTLAGFTTLKKGMTVTSNGKYYGVSEKAENLLVNGQSYAGSEFARLNSANVFTQPIRISNSNGLSIGETETLAFNVTGSNTQIVNKASDGAIDLRVQTTQTAIRIKSDGNVGIGTLAAEEKLDVAGNIKLSGKIAIGSTVDSSSISDSNASLYTPGGVAISKSLNVGGSANIEGNLEVGDITPQALGKNLGTAVLPYNNVYGNTFRGNLVGNVTGTLTGSVSGSAAKLNSATTFSISGDVSTLSDYSFDGTQGAIEMIVEIDPDLIADKTVYTDNDKLNGTETLLIYKEARNDTDPDNNLPLGLYKTTVNSVLATIPQFQPGMIMPYGAATAPTGWLLCYGQEVLITDYQELYDIIGTTFGTPSSALKFKVPDLRGRFPLGYLAGEGRTLSTDEDRVYDDAAADILGADGGKNRDWITKDQLPEHEHTLMGDAGNQYYAVNNLPSAGDGNSVAVNTLGTNPGRGLQGTEGVDGLTTTTETIDGTPQDVGNKFDTVPPFLAVNYIIYTGA